MSIMPGIETRAPERTETQQRAVRIAEALPDGALDPCERGQDVGFHGAREDALPAVLAADLGRDREAGRDGDAEPGHLGEVGSLAAEQLAHRRAAVGAPASEGEDPTRRTRGAGVGGPPRPGLAPPDRRLAGALAGPGSLDASLLLRRRLLAGRLPHRLLLPARSTHGGLLADAHRAPSSRRRRSSTRPAAGTRSCSMVSRSRTVTRPSPSDSKSKVTQNGVPTSSWRR